MLKRISALLLASALLTGSAQAAPFLSLSGNWDLSGSVGVPPGFIPGNYDFHADVAFAPSATNVAAITGGRIQYANGPGDAMFFGPPVAGTVTWSDNAGDDQVTVNMQLTPLSSVVFTFVNLNNRFTGTTGATEQHILSTVFEATSGVPSGTIPTGIPSVNIDSGSVAMAPEPSSFALLGALSVGGAGWYRRRRKATKSA